MKPILDYTLYLVTDRRGLHRPLTDAVDQAIRGGCTLIQLREKGVPSPEFCQTALELRELTRRRNVGLVINDRVDIALAVEADGVHIGQKDLPVPIVRSLLGEGKILGVSAATVEEALTAQKEGADYLGVGAVFPTGTKADARATPPEKLREICRAVQIPVVAIGGIGVHNVPQLFGTGISGLAVVSAVLGSPDIEKAARQLRTAWGK